MLVTDRREIEFDADALACYLSILPREAEKLGLPASPPVAIRFDPRDERVEAVYGTGAQARRISIQGESLGDMLVNYCIRTRIPLPRVADKLVCVRAESVVLSFRTWFDEAPVFEAVEPDRLRGGTHSWHWVEPGRAARGV